MKDQFIDRGNKLFKEYKNEDDQEKKSKIYVRILDLLAEAKKSLSEADYLDFQDNWMFRHTEVVKNGTVSMEDLDKILRPDPKPKS